MEVERVIDCTHIEHDQIYAQLKAELLAGRRDWFTKEEEQVLQVQNAAFYRVCPAEDVFHSYFRVANSGEKCIGLTAAQIFRELQQKNSAAMRSVNPMRFGQVLLKAGVVRRHTEYGNVYQVVRRQCD